MVAPIVVAAAIQAAGALQAKREKDAASRKEDELRDRAMSQYDGLNIPSVGDLSYKSGEEQYVGDIDVPDVYMPRDVDSKFADISTNPMFAQAQMDALGAGDAIIEGGGRTDMDLLNDQRAMMAAEQQASAQQADITQDMARRGMSGSGQEHLQKLIASQGSVNRAAEATQQTQAAAKQRALDMILNKGAMAGQMRGQEFGEEAQKAQALDAQARYNATQMLGQQNLQTGMGFEASQINKAAQQGLAERTANRTTDSNKSKSEAHRTQYGMEAGLAGAKSSAYGAAGGRAGEEGQEKAEGMMGMAGGASKLATAAMSSK